MPCRTRRGGLDVEGLGIVYLEASATGLPVVAGDSGGAPDAVLEGETGYVVPGRDLAARWPAGSDSCWPTRRARPAMGARGRPGWTGVALGPGGPPAGADPGWLSQPEPGQ